MSDASSLLVSTDSASIECHLVQPDTPHPDQSGKTRSKSKSGKPRAAFVYTEGRKNAFTKCQEANRLKREARKAEKESQKATQEKV